MGDYEKYYGQLVDFHIHKVSMAWVSFEEDEWEGDYLPVLHIRNTEGDSLRLVLSSDEEGNGAGFAFIEEDV
jgi:hypothetical protein